MNKRARLNDWIIEGLASEGITTNRDYQILRREYFKHQHRIDCHDMYDTFEEIMENRHPLGFPLSELRIESVEDLMDYTFNELESLRSLVYA